MLTVTVKHSMRVDRLYLLRRPRDDLTKYYNNMCIRGYLYNIHQYHSKEVFIQCTNGTEGEPFLRTDVTPNRIEFEVKKIVDRIIIDGSDYRCSFVWDL